MKKLRYALEAVAPLYGKPAVEMVRALRRWQENLGVQQDAAVAMPRLNALARRAARGYSGGDLVLDGPPGRTPPAAQPSKLANSTPRAIEKCDRRWKKLRTKFEKSTANETPTPRGAMKPWSC